MNCAKCILKELAILFCPVDCDCCIDLYFLICVAIMNFTGVQGIYILFIYCIFGVCNVSVFITFGLGH